MEQELKRKLIELGLDKINGQINLSWKNIGSEFGVDGETCRNLVKKYRYKNNLIHKKQEQDKKQENKLNILIFSDLHIPDHKEEMILNIVNDNKNVDIIVLNGDILDCQSVSSWFNEETTILDHEIIKAHELISKMRNLTAAKIMLVKGNHENRVNTNYAKNAKVMGSSVVETEILYKLANGFNIKYHKDNKRVYYEPIQDVEYCNGRTFILGDLLVNHPSIFRKDNMKTAYIIYNERLRQKYPEAKVVVIGHTHQLGQVFIDNGVVLIECGCVCSPAGYADKDDRPFKVQQYGYILMEMIENKVDVDSIKLVYLGSD